LTCEKIEANLENIKWEEMDKNIEVAAEKLRVFKLVFGSEERETVKVQLETSEAERNRLEKKQRVDFFAVMQRTRSELVKMQEHNDR
jgi:hypothetical protein